MRTPIRGEICRVATRWVQIVKRLAALTAQTCNDISLAITFLIIVILCCLHGLGQLPPHNLRRFVFEHSRAAKSHTCPLKISGRRTFRLCRTLLLYLNVSQGIEDLWHSMHAVCSAIRRRGEVVCAIARTPFCRQMRRIVSRVFLCSQLVSCCVRASSARAAGVAVDIQHTSIYLSLSLSLHPSTSLSPDRFEITSSDIQHASIFLSLSLSPHTHTHTHNVHP